MTARILDPGLVRLVVAERAKLGHDRHDEVWDGVYVIPPTPTIDQQEVVYELTTAIRVVAGRRADVLPGGNVSDRDADWLTNYRIPDVVAVLPGGRAINRNSHFWGGPDFVAEFRSPTDDSFQKLDFYAGVGVREVLVVERDTRVPHLFHRNRKRLSAVTPTAVNGKPWLVSQVLPLMFARIEVKGMPKLFVRRTSGAARTWRV